MNVNYNTFVHVVRRKNEIYNIEFESFFNKQKYMFY